MKKTLLAAVKREFVLVLATLAALISMVFVPPSRDYWAYIDFSVLAILFCLMAVVAGFLQSGLFDFLSAKMLGATDDGKKISALLVLLCFCSAMVITNDVALITFVPLTIRILGTGEQKRLIYLLVLETMAANLGSMLTPVGNPQNLYLYAYYHMSIGAFMATVLPVCLFGLAFLAVLLLLGKGGKITAPAQEPVVMSRGRLALFGLLFALCIATVLRLVDYRLCLAITVLVLALFARELFARIDYALLLTFVAFFVFVGNLSAIPAVAGFLSQLSAGRELLVAIAASQVISNVPAAIMLSGFTENAGQLLLGVNIGGLGTLIASLASLISYKLYAKSQGAQPGRFLGVFTVLNLIGLVALTAFALVF